MMLVLLLLFLSVQLICFWHAAYVTFQTYPVPCRHDGIYCTTCALQLFDSRGFYSTIMFFTLTCNLILVEFKCTCSSLILGLFNQKKKKKKATEQRVCGVTRHGHHARPGRIWLSAPTRAWRGQAAHGPGRAPDQHRYTDMFIISKKLHKGT